MRLLAASCIAALVVASLAASTCAEDVPCYFGECEEEPSPQTQNTPPLPPYPQEMPLPYPQEMPLPYPQEMLQPNCTVTHNRATAFSSLHTHYSIRTIRRVCELRR